ncbi:acyl-homoserine-lactone synthase [Pseudoroseicyclus sp. CXY001]|uniref:acyl-homoserine-lactone synthase n=1 Tax=Pseudoroseicyclus sp. CXY001 TaxID=3242492 RepID=UPI003571359E
MEATTLSFANIHNHGELFANLFRARRQSFILKKGWDLPETMGMEFDQYDTPVSRWVAVHNGDGRVLAGLRMTPTLARCGIYTYMIRDAQRGLLESIPSDLLYEEAPLDQGIWEVTRGFILQDIPAAMRLRVRLKLISQLTAAARENDVRQGLALLPSNWGRWAKRANLNLSPAGRTMNMGGIEYQAVWMQFASNLH